MCLGTADSFHTVVIESGVDLLRRVNKIKCSAALVKQQCVQGGEVTP